MTVDRFTCYRTDALAATMRPVLFGCHMMRLEEKLPLYLNI